MTIKLDSIAALMKRKLLRCFFLTLTNGTGLKKVNIAIKGKNCSTQQCFTFVLLYKN